MEEKRKHKRIKVQTVGEVYRRADDFRFKVNLGDISFGGAEIFSEKKFEKGDRLEIMLTFPVKKGGNIMGLFTGKVCWAVSYNKGFIGGFQFDKVITRETQPEIFTFILKDKGFFG